MGVCLEVSSWWNSGMDCKDSEMTERRDEYEFHMEEAKFLMPSPAIAPKDKSVQMDTSILHHYLQVRRNWN